MTRPVLLSIALLAAVPLQAPSAPNAERIAFASHRDGNWEVYVMDADGARPARLTRRPDQDRFPLPSPDGSRLAFGSQVDGTRIAAKARREWSPDGTRLTFSSSRGSSSSRRATAWTAPCG